MLDIKMPYLKKLIDSLTQDVRQGEKRMVLVRHHGSFKLQEIVKESIGQLSPIVQPIYKTYEANVLQAPYEPFLSWLKEQFEPLSLAEQNKILKDSNVYSLHRELFLSYFSSGIVHRSEPLWPQESNYEKTRLYQSLLNLFKYFSRIKPLFICLDNLEYAPISTILWIKWLLSQENKLHLCIIASFNENVNGDNLFHGVWEDFVEYVEFKQVILDAPNVKNKATTKVYSSHSTCDLFKEPPLQFFTNQVLLFAYEDCSSHLTSLLTQISEEQLMNEHHNFFEYLALMGQISFYQRDLKTASEHFKRLDDKAFAYKRPYDRAIAMQGLSKIYFLKQNYSLSEKYANQSLELAKPLNDDKLLFDSYIIFYWINLAGLYHVGFEMTALDTLLLDLCKKLDYKNSLAYLLTHCYLDLDDFSTNRDEEEYLSDGIMLATDLDNKYCLASTYLENALRFSIKGDYDKVLKYYKRVEGLFYYIDDPILRIRTYNGLGYFYLSKEKYVEADLYFNKAIVELRNKWHFEDLSITLMNKALNAFLAEDFNTANICYEQLLCIIKILKLDRLRVCTLARIYALVSLNYFYLGYYYRSLSFLSKLEKSLSHILPNYEHANYAFWDDELFLFFYIRGLVNWKDTNLSDALLNFERAQFHMNRVNGSLNFIYPHFAMEYAKLLSHIKREGEAKTLLLKALEFCSVYDYPLYSAKIKERLGYGRQNIPKPRCIDPHLSLDWVTEITKHQALLNELDQGMEEINFLNAWQDNLSNVEVEEITIEASMNTIINRYAVDRIIFLQQKTNNEWFLSYSSLSSSPESLQSLIEPLCTIDRPFVSSHLSELDQRVYALLKAFGIEEVLSLLFIPLTSMSEHKSIFIGFTENHPELFTGQRALNDNHLRILSLALNELKDSLDKLHWKNQIVMVNTELEYMNKRLFEMASTDMLTGLLNRQGFLKRLEKLYNKLLIIDPKPHCGFSLLYIDLDNFKYYNDTFGHSIGDSILIHFAELLTQTLRPTDYAVRYGGDEFIILLDQLDEDAALVTSQKIYDGLARANYFHNAIGKRVGREINIPQEYYLSCSIGIATYQMDDPWDTTALLKRADIALYEAKNTGKHHCCRWSQVSSRHTNTKKHG